MQPLFRNFKIDSNRQQLVVTKLNQDISEIQLQATIINTLSNVRNAYWDYVFAVQSVEVARRSVALAEQLVKDNQTRVEVGTMAPIDVVQAQSQAATQRQNLAVAEGTRRTTELSAQAADRQRDRRPELERRRIDPIDQPDVRAGDRSTSTSAVRRALDERTDLAQVAEEPRSQRRHAEVPDATRRLPQVDFTARYGLTGQGGTQFISSGNGVNRVGDRHHSRRLQRRAEHACSTTTTRRGHSASTSAIRSARARRRPRWRARRLQSNQVEAQLKQIELQIATDVTNAATSVQNNVERVQAAQAAREFAQQQLEAEQSKFEVGMSTNYFVVQAQRDLATAQNNELSAILAYRQSLVEARAAAADVDCTSANITILRPVIQQLAH